MKRVPTCEASIETVRDGDHTSTVRGYARGSRSSTETPRWWSSLVVRWIAIHSTE